MSLITKKDIHLLLEAGFSEEDLGFTDGGKPGVQLYETPDDYFARELIENACEQGECTLVEDPPMKSSLPAERYDTSRPGLYDDQGYFGNEDWMEGVPQDLRDQAEWLRTIKIGKLSVWQRKGKAGYEWPVKNLKVTIPADDLDRYNRLSREDQKILWCSYARDVWKEFWTLCAMSLQYIPIEETFKITTASGSELNILAISVEDLKKQGCVVLPPEARWVTMVYFEKEERD